MIHTHIHKYVSAHVVAFSPATLLGFIISLHYLCQAYLGYPIHWTLTPFPIKIIVQRRKNTNAHTDAAGCTAISFCLYKCTCMCVCECTEMHANALILLRLKLNYVRQYVITVNEEVHFLPAIYVCMYIHLSTFIYQQQTRMYAHMCAFVCKTDLNQVELHRQLSCLWLPMQSN